jgi:NAD(P)-dependent dehydrogenase (short-subunit alcohol dehydrogenase family)
LPDCLGGDWEHSAVVEFGRLDAAFNNAGVMAKLAPTAASTLEEFDRVTRVNLRGVWS